MGKIAFVFPGQGAQYVGMAREVAVWSAKAGELIRLADDRLGFALSRLMFEGPAEELTLTANAQPALVTASLACYQLLKEAGVVPSVVAGNSLGEYAALAVAGAMSAEDAIWLVRQRGIYMNEAVPAGVGGMVALLGVDASQAQALCTVGSAYGVVEIANYNCPGQIVVSGEAAALAAVKAHAKEHGAKRAVDLAVSGPFHSSMLKPAGLKLAQAIDQITVHAPQITVIANYTAQPVETREAVIDALINQVSHPVRWEETIRLMAAMGVDTIVEVGAGKVLTGLTKKIAPGICPVSYTHLDVYKRQALVSLAALLSNNGSQAGQKNMLNRQGPARALFDLFCTNNFSNDQDFLVDF